VAKVRETDDDIKTGSFPFAAIARAAIYADNTGFLNSIHGGSGDEVLGVVIVGINTTEIVNAGMIAFDA
jgi:dihydrolipoamide dehydrogenase